jgi:hypothetical protein
MEEAIRALLLANSGVSGRAGNRINFGTHPQGEPFPAIVLNTISDLEEYTLSGPVGVTQARIQADCYDATYGGAKLLARSVRTLLSGYSGGSFQGVFLASSRDGREGGSNQAELPYRVSMDFLIHFSTS